MSDLLEETYIVECAHQERNNLFGSVFFFLKCGEDAKMSLGLISNRQNVGKHGQKNLHAILKYFYSK
jgi:hypothetical protein